MRRTGAGTPQLKLKKQLEHLLKAHDITASELARRSGVPKQSISDWLAGVSPSSVERLKRVASVFGVSVDALCFGEEGAVSPSSELAQVLGVLQLPESESRPSGSYEVVLRKIET